MTRMAETTDVTLRRFSKAKLRQLKVLAAMEGAGRSNRAVIEWAVTQFLLAQSGRARRPAPAVEAQTAGV